MLRGNGIPGKQAWPPEKSGALYLQLDRTSLSHPA